MSELNYIFIGIGMISICMILIIYVVIKNSINQQNALMQQQLNNYQSMLTTLINDQNNQSVTLNAALNQVAILNETIKQNDKSMAYLNQNIHQFNSVLNDKKLRGVFGEAQLESIYQSIFGMNSQIYQMQYKLANNCIVDSVIKMPGNTVLCVDAKFPLENYHRLMNVQLDSVEFTQILKLFKQDIKVKIDSIADKYILQGITCDYALMFIPSMSVYDSIIEHCIDCVEYAFKKRVMLVSPINLMMSVDMIKKWHLSIAQVEDKEMIMQALSSLQMEFIHYKQRSEQVEKELLKVVENYRKLMITSDKLVKRFDAINQLNRS